MPPSTPGSGSRSPSDTSRRPAVVAEVVRSGFVEGHHHGSVVALAADGSVAWAVGDVESQILPRSCNKPLQAVGMLRAGLDLDGRLLALASASHSGEDFHLAGVRRILADAGLTEHDLQTPPDLPLDDQARAAWLRSGEPPASVAMNCSGKHAAMLATCIAAGWDPATYLRPDHPLQRHIAATFAELTGEPVEAVAVDGCGAPLLSTSLTGLARAFRSVATATDGPERRVADAIRAFPEFTSGTRRDEAVLLRALPGAVGKAGAEACYALALADGRAVALKIDDGAARVRPVLMAAALELLGVTSESWVDAAAVRGTGAAPLFGGGRRVGEIRAAVAPARGPA
jgi:L-asparaginase II